MYFEDAQALPDTLVLEQYWRILHVFKYSKAVFFGNFGMITNMKMKLPSTSDSKLFPSTIILGEGLTSKFRLSQVVCSKEEPAIAPMASTILCVTSW